MTESRADKILLAASEAIRNAGGEDALAQDILGWSEDCAVNGRDWVDPFDWNADDDPIPSLGIRLRIYCDETNDPTDPESWRVWIDTGLPDYDTDHRGSCGAGCAWASFEGIADEGTEDEREVFAPMTSTQAREEAQHIIDKCLDCVACCLDI